MSKFFFTTDSTMLYIICLGTCIWYVVSFPSRRQNTPKQRQVPLQLETWPLSHGIRGTVSNIKGEDCVARFLNRK